jgi:hypothetical protein
MVGRWWRWRCARRARERVRARCELREQRLEEADVPTWPLENLHLLAYRAFDLVDVERTDIDQLLDLYTELSIQRRWYQVQLRCAPPRLVRRWQAYVPILDDSLADIDALIRLYCERAMYGQSVASGARSAREGVNQ